MELGLSFRLRMAQSCSCGTRVVLLHSVWWCVVLVIGLWPVEVEGTSFWSVVASLHTPLLSLLIQ